MPCNFYMQPFRWQLYRLNAGIKAEPNTLTHFGMLTAPTFAMTSQYKVYYHNGNDMKWIQIGTHRSTARVPELIIEQDNRGNPINKETKYRVGVLTYTYQNYTEYVRLWAPKTYDGRTNFQSSGPLCRVNFGF